MPTRKSYTNDRQSVFTMTNDKLFYFLGKCLSMNDDQNKTQEVIHIIKNEKIDWDRFVVMGSRHLVLPSVYLRFKQQGILPYLSTELSNHLQMIYELNFQRNTAILTQINSINSLFASAGIVPIYLKGAGNLLDHLYEDVGERMLGDIDLLVSDMEFLQAANLLKSDGYQHPYLFFEDQQAYLKHFPRLAHPTQLADVEVHRLPVEIDLANNFNYAIIRPETKQIETVPPCYVLSDRHKVILNFMHGYMGNDVRLMHMVSFRNMVDLLFLSHRIDVYEVLAQQTQYTSKAMIYADFVNHTMGFDSSRKPTLQSKFFIRKHDLLIASRFLYRLAWLASYLSSRIWSSYFRNIAGVFLSKRIRKSVFRNLSTPTWYKLHLKSYAKSFKQNLC